MKMLCLGVLILISVTGLNAWSYFIFSYPKNPLSSSGALRISNPETASIQFEVVDHATLKVIFETVEIKSGGTLDIPLNKLLTDYFYIRSSSQGLKAELLLPTTLGGALSLHEEAPNHWRYHCDDKPGGTALELQILNLHASPQKIRLFSGRDLLEEKISPSIYESLFVPLSCTGDVDIYSEGRMQVIIRKDNHFEWATPVFETGLAPAESHFFEMSNTDNTSGFVIQISDPEILAKAQKALGENRYQLLFADIQPGYQNWNRNLNLPHSTPWGWTVKQVLDFADLGPIDCDGSPESVEEFVSLWAPTHRICFWNYFLKREIPVEELFGL